jgi:hypothetical protein
MSAFNDAIQANIGKLKAVSTGVCPGCETCRVNHDPKLTMEEFDKEWSAGRTIDEDSFSWRPCGICGTTLGGDRHVWHYLDEDNDICHEGNACTDCVMFLANGDEPDEWPG